MESLANSTYSNFQNIKNSSNTDNILKQIDIHPKDYMMLIYNLTEDLTKRGTSLDDNVRSVSGEKFLYVFQVLTENGICYSTTNHVARSISTASLLQGKDPFPDKNDSITEVRKVNIFEGDVNVNFLGFSTDVQSYFHSSYEILNVARGLGWTNESYDFDVQAVDIITSDQFRDTTFISQRGCRFPSESNLTHYKYYSKQLCFSECRLNLVMKHCGCIPHFYPNRSIHSIYFKN
jgi:acid-sensing ion channel, other